ncbi:MAG: ParM/StbA family protein [Cetobacterium sp.]|uniref:ParM/StbA family protein n=1 Tax=Bacteria TaxID=2 RepID=UPI002FCCB151
MSTVQNIGADIGRGYVKGYTEIEGNVNSCMFKSVVGLGRQMEFENYEDPIFLKVAIGNKCFENVFCGLLAEVEGHAPIRNSMDSKNTDTVRKLLAALLSKIAVKEEVNIMLGVPNREFTKTNLAAIVEDYKGKTVEVLDYITKESKKITIKNISIFRESDAALLYQVTKNKLNNGNDHVMVNVGFRTTEISFYDNELKYNDKKSKSLELGNKTVLEYVQNIHDKRSLEEIDTSSRYDDLKSQGYQNLAENIEQTVESLLVNMDEINLYACGGVIKNLDLSDKFIPTEDPQMITSKGLYLIATRKF